MLDDKNQHVIDELNRRALARAKADKADEKDTPTKKSSPDSERSGDESPKKKKKKKDKKDSADTSEKDVGKWKIAHMSLAESRFLIARHYQYQLVGV